MKLAKEKPEFLNYSSKSNLDFTTAYALLSAPDEVKQEVQAKQQLPHGEFGDWLKANCRVTQRQAQKYMKLAIDMPELLNSNTKFTSHLKIEAAYALLSAPDEVKQEVQAKQQLPHGEFGEWLKVNCRVKQRQANDYMKLAVDMPELLDSNSRHAANLSVRAAYALLSAPDEVKQEVQAKQLRCLTCKSLKSGIIQLSQNVITEENNGLGLKHLNQSSHNPDRYRH